jgi:hypothetical protein
MNFPTRVSDKLPSSRRHLIQRNIKLIPPMYIYNVKKIFFFFMGIQPIVGHSLLIIEVS